MSRDDDVGKVYVGGVLGLEEADLRKEFEPFGKVRRAWVARNPPGFAFLWFEDPLDAEDACRDLNNKEITPTNRLRVELSKPGAGGGGRGGGGRDGGGGRGGGRGWCSCYNIR